MKRNTVARSILSEFHELVKNSPVVQTISPELTGYVTSVCWAASCPNIERWFRCMLFLSDIKNFFSFSKIHHICQEIHALETTVNSRKWSSSESFRTNMIFPVSSGEIDWTTAIGGLKSTTPIELAFSLFEPRRVCVFSARGVDIDPINETCGVGRSWYFPYTKHKPTIFVYKVHNCCVLKGGSIFPTL